MHGDAKLLADLGRLCISAPATEALLAVALPALLELSAAHTVVVQRRSGDQQIVAAQAGRTLQPDTMPGLTSVAEQLTVVAVPATWAALGITRTAAQQLPEGVGVIIFAWGHGEPADSAMLAAGLAMLGGSVARLVAEERLSDLMLRVDNAQSLANMGDYDWHIASDTNRWSDQLYRIYGHEPQSFEANYSEFLAHIHPDDRDRITEIHQQAYASGEPYQMIERVVRPDGQIRYLSSNGQVIRDANGTPVRMRGTCIDVTDRVLAEQERERSAARFRGLVESSPDAIMVVDHENRIVQANGKASDLLGADPVGHVIDEISSFDGTTDQAVAATGFDGRRLQLDVSTARLSPVDDERVTAIFLADAAPRLASEASAAGLREAQVRRRQALEMNDNVVQGLTAAMYSLDDGNVGAGTAYLEGTASAARRMMNEWLSPLTGGALHAGDLVRDAPSTLDGRAHDDAPQGPWPAGVTDLPRVLVVDDNQDLRMLIRLHVEAIGKYEVVGEAGDGEEAVAMAAQLQPNVVLLDLAMPRMDGLQALPLILEAAPGVRVVVLSGFDKGMMAKEVLAAGAARYIEKGVRLDLADVLAEVLSAA